MTDSNLTRIAYGKETTEGVAATNLKTLRMTGESLNIAVQYTESQEIRSDRQLDSAVFTGKDVSGAINFELSYGTFDDLFEGVFFNNYVKTPEISNGGVADSAITGVTNSSDTIAVASGGTAFVDGHLIRTNGFTNAANNNRFRVGSSTSTSIVLDGLPVLVDEAAPAANARIKVIGFQGETDDLAAVSDGLASTALNFTTLGLSVGMMIKIGGELVGEKFATAANNTFVRIVAITATKLTLDMLPPGWAADTGTGKTITVYIPDGLKIGTTRHAFTIEKGFLGQTVPTYEQFTGLLVNQLQLQTNAKAMVTGNMSFMGRDGTVSTTPLDGSPDPASTTEQMNTVTDVSRIYVAGVESSAPNFVMQSSLSLNNNLRGKDAIGVAGYADIGVGRADVSGSLSIYYGDKSLKEKALNNEDVSLLLGYKKDGQAYVFMMPRVKLTQNNTPASGGNQDVMQSINYRAQRDATFGNTLFLSRFEEVA